MSLVWGYSETKENQEKKKNPGCLKDLNHIFSFMFSNPHFLMHIESLLSELISPSLLFTDFGFGAACTECAQLIPGDSELLSHSACPCGHSVIHAF